MPSAIPFLSLAIWVPIIAGLLVLAAGGDRNAPMQRGLAMLGALAGFAVTIPLYTGFDTASAGMQFVELHPWIERFNVNYHLGVDGISVLFVLLNSFVTILVVIAGWSVIENRVAQYYASFLVLSGLMNGVFCALDGVLFYVFFEATLIPMFIIIGVWGGPNRVYAALKFFLYTLAGSLLLLGNSLNVLQFGDEQAQQLGLPVVRTRTLLLLAASLATAAAAPPLKTLTTLIVAFLALLGGQSCTARCAAAIRASAVKGIVRMRRPSASSIAFAIAAAAGERAVGYMMLPPLTMIVCPVMKLASSDARKRMALAMSSGCAMRFR